MYTFIRAVQIIINNLTTIIIVLLSSSYSTTDCSIVAIYNNDLQNHLPSSIWPRIRRHLRRDDPGRARTAINYVFYILSSSATSLLQLCYIICCSGHAHAHERNVHRVRLFLHSFYVCVCAHIHTKVRTAARTYICVRCICAPTRHAPLAVTVYDICRSRDDAGRRRVERARALHDKSSLRTERPEKTATI